MTGHTQIRRKWLVATLLSSFPGLFALAQVPVDDTGAPLPSLESEAAVNAYEAEESPVILNDAELQELVGPIALYPDDLLAIVLPASTYPLQIVQAVRFLDAYEQDSSLEPEEEWDESVVALLNYPDVLRLMDEDIEWTWQLGQAVIDQQPDIISAVEDFRDRAYAAGNLKSDDHQEVRYDDDIIEIVPIEDDIIYVPYYEPEEVVVRQSRPVYYYYPVARPVYYYPYPSSHYFASGYFWGVTSAFTIGWSNNYLHVYHPNYWGHPYYGRSYYGHYYRRPSVNVYNTTYVVNRPTVNRHRDGHYWSPRRRSGARQVDYVVRTRDTARTTRTTQDLRRSAYRAGDRRSRTVTTRTRTTASTTRQVPDRDSRRTLQTNVDRRNENRDRRRATQATRASQPAPTRQAATSRRSVSPRDIVAANRGQRSGGAASNRSRAESRPAPARQRSEARAERASPNRERTQVRRESAPERATRPAAERARSAPERSRSSDRPSSSRKARTERKPRRRVD